MYKQLLQFKTFLLVCLLAIVGTNASWGTEVTITFGTGNGAWAAHTTSTYTDSDSIQWTRTYSAGNKSSGQAGYSQFGNSSNACTSLVLTATTGKEITLTTFSVTMAGASGGNTPTAGTIYLYKRTSGGTETELASATVSGTNNVSCSISSSQTFSSTDILKVEYVGTAKAVRISALSYSYTTNSSSAVATTTAIDDSGITNTDVYTNTDAGSLSASVISSGNAVDGATVTWSGDNDDVAIIDTSTGAVTLVAAGTVTFTASYADVSGTYAPSSDTYEMIVTSSAPYVQPTSIEITPNYTFWGKNAQFSGSAYDELSGAKENVSLTWTRGSGSTYANQTAMRFYKDNTLAFTAPTGYEIKSIILEGSLQSDLTFSPEGFGSENQTWTGSASTVTMSRPSNGSSYASISKYTITIGLPSTDPIIVASNPDELAYDATSGEFGYSITNPADGVNLSATSNADWITSVAVDGTNSKVTFSTSANPNTTQRTGTITLSYTGATEKVITITQAAAPVVYTTIPALFEAATSTATNVLVTFNNWVVSGVSTNGKRVFVTDGSNGFIIYSNDDQSSTYAVGNVLSGTAVECTLQLSNGYAQVTNLDASDLTISTGGTVSAANIAMNELAGVNTGALVSYENLTCSVSGSYYSLTDGTTTLQAYNSLYAFTELEDGKTYNITGIYQQYGSTKEILPRSAADIEEVVVTTPSITVSSTSVNATAAETEGTIDIDYANLTISDRSGFDIQFYDAEENELSSENEPDWIVALVAEQDPSIGEGYVVSYVIDANEGEARSAYFKVYAMDDETNLVYSDLITVTQAAYVDPNAKYNWIQTDLADLTSSDVFVIVGDNGDSYAMPNDNGTSSAPSAVKINVVNKTLSSAPAAKLQWNLSGNATDGYTFYPNGTTESWLYCIKDNNGLRVGTGENSVFTITTDSYLYNNGQKRYIGIYNSQDWRSYTSINSNIANQTFTFFKRVPVTNKTVTIDNEHYATLYHGTNLEIPTGVVAKTVTVDEEGILTVKDISGGVIPALTGVLLYAAESNNTQYTFTGTEDYSLAVTNNDLTGVLTDQTVSEEGYVFFKLADGENGGALGFYYDQENGTSIHAKAGKAFLRVSEESAQNIRGFVLSDAKTGVAEFTMQTKQKEAYDLQGRRVNTLGHGLYIINGKKVFNK
ncbi:MAG: BACON domain-containing protein [Alloprevotella sp.]|nr:BACON domain-containing protein [Alloprevotella sp.]